MEYKFYPTITYCNAKKMYLKGLPWLLSVWRSVHMPSMTYSQDVSFFLATDDPAVEERMKSRGMLRCVDSAVKADAPQKSSKWNGQVASGNSSEETYQRLAAPEPLRLWTSVVDSTKAESQPQLCYRTPWGKEDLKISTWNGRQKYVMKFWLVHHMIVILRIPVFVVLFSLKIS